MKKFLTFLICIFAFFQIVFSQTGFCATKNEDFRDIYYSLEPANFDYIFGLDPFQAEEYQKYLASPYPLLRTGVDFFFKGTKIPAGYYLLTAREKDGVQYVLFKQEGKVKYIIPTYKKELVDPLFYEKHVPTPKKTAWNKACDFGNKFISKTSKTSKRTLPPKAYIDVNEIGNEFWEVILYYGSQKYFMVFSQK